MIVAKAPGKLFIAGEYAVVEPGHTAILVAVDRFITITIEEAVKKGSICICKDEPIYWIRDNEKILLEKEEPYLKHILSAIYVFEKYARELGKVLSYYDLGVNSDLQDESGVKYGLGSSAAVIVGTVDALCRYNDIKISKEELFKLSALASLLVNSRSSCGDIAASVYGGWIAYTAFDREFVLKGFEGDRVLELIKLQWPRLKVEKLAPPKELHLAIGWTGMPASTANLVHNIRQRSSNNKEIYERFLTESQRCVNRMIDGFKSNSIEDIQRQILKNRELLIELGSKFNVDIETNKLKKLCDIALKYKGSAKLSGAGGGDCGIAIFNGYYNLDLLIEEWERAGIVYLPLKVYYKKGD